MKIFSAFSRISLSTIVIGAISLLLGLLIYSSYETMASKLGLETKAAVQQKLTIANEQLSRLQSVNHDLVAQLATQEERHKKELKSTRDVMNHAITVTKKLNETKQILAKQNDGLKKKIKEDQDKAYAEFNVSKDLYFVYLRAGINTMSSNNYDSLLSFVNDKVHGFQASDPVPVEEKVVPGTKVATDDFETVILALVQQEEK